MVFCIIFFTVRPANLEAQSSVFCAYGKVFVEFEEGDKRWGTMLLNDNGKPIQCQEPFETPAFSRSKENII